MKFVKLDDTGWPKHVCSHANEDKDTYLFEDDKIVIVNTVYTFDLNIPAVNIEQLTPNIPCSYNKKQKPGTLRLYPDRCTCLVYAKGSAVIIGNRTLYAAIYTARIYCRMVSRTIRKPVKIKHMYLKNITATIKMPFYVNVTKFQNLNRDRTEKGMHFPGLRFYLDKTKSKTVQIIFPEKVLITGAKSIGQIVDIYRQTKPLYEECYSDTITRVPKMTITEEERDFLNSIIDEN